MLQYVWTTLYNECSESNEEDKIMAKLELTNVKTEKLNQNDFKKITCWKVEKTQNDYKNYILCNDFSIFMLGLVRLNLNKNGTVPKNISRALCVAGGTLDEAYMREYKHTGWNAYYFTASDKKEYKIYVRIVQQYSSLYLELNCVPLKDGYSYGSAYKHSVNITDKHITCEQDLLDICQNEIEKLREYNKGYLEILKDIPRVARAIEKVNFRNLYTSSVKEWF